MTIEEAVPAASTTPVETDFDIHDSTQVDRIYDVYAELRRECPVAHSSKYGGHWVVTGFDEAKEIFRHHDVFSSAHVNIPETIGQEGPMIPIEIDPPDHSVYRNLLLPVFSPPRMRALEADIDAIVDRLLDELVGRSKVDFVEVFAKPLPTTVFLALMGWPHDDAPLLQDWVDRVVLGLPGASEEEVAEYRESAAIEAYAYFGEMLDDRMEHPERYPDDITGVLVNGKFGDRDLTQFEVLNMLFLIMIAGLDTVQGALAHSMMYFATHPETRHQLAERPEILESAVEEMLRYEAAVTPARVVAQDVVLGGVQLQAGDRIMFPLGAVNRDPDAFPNPDEVDLTRDPNPHLAFGAGVHRCIGSHLARIELRVAFDKFHQRIPEYRLDPDDPPKMHLSQIKGVERLPLILGESL